LNQTTFLTKAQALLGKAISEHTTQRNAKVKTIINKDRQVAPKRMPLGARLAVTTHNMGGRFVESVKNARWSMSPQEAGDGHESIVQIKGHNQQEYEDKWQRWQNRTDEKLATNLTKDDQQPVLLLPARWWPDTLPEFESGGWWQRPHKRVRCWQCKCNLVENPSFESSNCHLLRFFGGKTLEAVYVQLYMNRKNPSQLICCTRLPLTACKALDNVFQHRIHAHRCQSPSHLCHVLFLIRGFMHKAATSTLCLSQRENIGLRTVPPSYSCRPDRKSLSFATQQKFCNFFWKLPHVLR